ncbi:MAG: hypothetical protein LJF30_07125 [Acidobacteria bacterium]|nr:hypothetical protein [Acidobacteriota bacterium]
MDASRNRFAFTGHIYDSETGLYNAKARYFDPKLGRFLTQDRGLNGQASAPDRRALGRGRSLLPPDRPRCLLRDRARPPSAVPSASRSWGSSGSRRSLRGGVSR